MAPIERKALMLTHAHIQSGVNLDLGSQRQVWKQHRLGRREPSPHSQLLYSLRWDLDLVT